MARYIWRDGGFVSAETGEPMEIPQRDGLCVPKVQRDVQEYRSPIDGTLITSRSQEREELKKHGCVIVPPKPKREFVNPHFMKKRGIAPDGRKDPGRYR